MRPNPSRTYAEIMDDVSKFDILYHYFGVDKLPVLINAPYREDNHPSVGLRLNSKGNVVFHDFATDESGGLYDLLMKTFDLSFTETLNMVNRDSASFGKYELDKSLFVPSVSNSTSKRSSLGVSVRKWMEHDRIYWESFGITLKWLNYANVYPIDYTFIHRPNQRYVIRAEKYAYVFVENKEDNISVKIYQPFSKEHKWMNNNDRSVVGLWSKIPEKGNLLIICSSLKDALCLWSNTGIPCIYVQSETTGMSVTAQNVLKERFKHICVFFDNDSPGLVDGVKFSETTGFTNIVLPQFEGGKDISDYYKKLNNKQQFKKNIIDLIKKRLHEREQEDKERNQEYL